MFNKITDRIDIKIPDKRLKTRFIKSLLEMFNNPEKSLPSTFKDNHQLKGLYRLLDNKKVRLESILEYAKNLTNHKIDELAKSEVLLTVQDTSIINYSHHPSKKFLGPTQNNIKHGLKIHPIIVLTGDRIPLGILATKIWTSDSKVYEENKQKSQSQKSKERRLKPIEEKESYRWIESFESSKELSKKYPKKEIINIGDSESDIYDLFVKGSESEALNTKYIVRNSQSRPTEEGTKLKENLYSEKAKGEIKFELKRENKKEYIHQEIRYNLK